MSDIRNLAIVLVAFGFGWWLLNRQAQAQMQQPSPAPSTPTATPVPTSSTPFRRSPTSVTKELDAKYNIHNCELAGPIQITGINAELFAYVKTLQAFQAGKPQCITEGNKHGIIWQFANGLRCSTKCTGGNLDKLTAADKKRLGIDKCKCNATRSELHAEMMKSKSSYAKAYTVYAHNIPRTKVGRMT